MYSFFPFLGGALIAAGILSAFAPGSDISAGDPPLALVQGINGGGSGMADKDGTQPGMEGTGPGARGAGDGSTGPTRPMANTADTSREIQREQQQKQQQRQQKQHNDPLAPLPGAK